MDIRSGFRVVLGAGALLTIAAAFSLVLSQYVLIEDTSRGEELDHLSSEGMHLVQLTNEVLLYGEPRAVQQWQAQYGRLREGILVTPPKGEAELDSIMTALARRFAQLEPLMASLSEARSQSSEVADILRSQLFQDATQLQASLRDLKAYSEEAVRRAHAGSRQRQLLIFATFLALLGIYVVAASVLFRARVMAPLARLGKTIEAIREGRHDARARVRTEDEMGMVCRTFDMLLDEQDKSRHELEDQARALRQANADLESFAWVASHDLREPLRMVSNYVSLIERRLGPAADADMRVFIGYAVDGAKRMYDLIGGLLDYARIGRSEGGFEDLPMDEIFRECLRDLSIAIAESGATVDVAEKLPVVRGARTLISRLFRNLIENAVKFRQVGRPPVVTIGCDDLGAEWRFFVSDNGIGLDPAYGEKIFGMFQRVAPREKYEGTGIGLSLCKRIAEHHGGRIWVESREGEGATFFVVLPKGD